MENKENINKPDTSTSKDRVKKSLVLLAILVVLIVGIVVSIVYIPRGLNSLASVSLSSIFKPKEKIVVSADKTTLASGELITLSWNGPVREDGAYTISYPCKEGVNVRFHSGEALTCNVPFYFTSPDNTASVRIYSTDARNVDVPLYLNFKSNDGETALVGDALVTVGTAGGNTANTPVATPAAPTTTTTSKPTVTANKPIAATKPATTVRKGIDLEARVIAIGSISTNNTFTPGTTVPAGSRPAIRFEVTNIGSGVSGGWTFKANTPSPTTPVFVSGLQASLASGDKIEFTLGFDNSSTGGTVVISVNEDDRVVETDYSNNTISYVVGGTTGSITSTATTTAVSGKDVSARIIAVGYMNNGVFVQSTSTATTARAAVKFVISNLSSQNINSASWVANLPSTSDTTYTGTASVEAGKSVEYTLAFDNIKTGSNAVTISVDSDNSISEVNENNNIATAVMMGY